MPILPFEKLGAKDADRAGGKGASLGEMTRAGIPVPPGFVVLADTFDEFVSGAGLQAKIDELLAKVDPDQQESLEKASRKIKEMILAAEMPAAMEEEIRSRFGQLDAEFVAVRSSATAEDSADAAWAGQLDTFLNTIAEDLLEKVKLCWASLFTPRAIFYRFENKLDATHISVAVVVQKMVMSEVAGVAFSVHPVTKNKSEMVIEAALGLGEAIVSGQVTPDNYVVSKEPLRMVHAITSEQERAIVRGKKGGDVWEKIPAGKGSEQKLQDGQILQLAELVVEIEKHYGFPCDIEWALAGGKFYILQSRPITTL